MKRKTNGIIAAMRSDKLAIICSGGGMRCAWTGGFLTALGEKLHFNEPDILIPPSGSAGGGLYYVTGQYDLIRKIWTELLSTPRFISFRRPTIMDIDYLIDTVFKRLAPFAPEKLVTVRTRFFVPLTDYKTGKGVYVSNDDGIDPFELLRAAKAVPLLFGRHVDIAGKTYIDGDVAVPPEEHIAKAVAEGASIIILLRSNNPVRLGTRLLLLCYSLTLNAGLAQAIRRRLRRSSVLPSAPANVRMLTFEAGKDLRAGLLTRDRTQLTEAFERGYADALASEELREILDEYGAHRK